MFFLFVSPFISAVKLYEKPVPEQFGSIKHYFILTN